MNPNMPYGQQYPPNTQFPQQYPQNTQFPQQYPQNQQFNQQYPQNQQFNQQYPQNQQFNQQYPQNQQFNQQMNWQQQQAQSFQQNQQQQQKLQFYQQLIQSNSQQLLQILQNQNNFMEAFQYFPILFSQIYQQNPMLFQNIKNFYPMQINQLISLYPSNFPNSNPNPPQPNPNNSELKELIPRNTPNFSSNEALDPNQNIVNVTFKVSTGTQANIAVNGNITIEQLIKKYIHKLNLSENVIGKDIMFIFNGQKLDPHLKQDVNSTFGNGGLISVYDINNIIGA